MAEAYFGRLLTAMVTPFNADGSVNCEAAADFAEWLLANGSDGLVVEGSTGEAATMFMDEKIAVLKAVVERVNGGEKSYTKYLFTSGQDKILKKVGEEAAETIIASKNHAKDEVLYEMSDLWYHCLVLLAYHNITPTELLNELGGRRAKENNSKY